VFAISFRTGTCSITQFAASSDSSEFLLTLSCRSPPEFNLVLNRKGTNLFFEAGDMCLPYMNARRHSRYLNGNLQQVPVTLAHPDPFPNITLD
jgi:hypothetical protein